MSSPQAGGEPGFAIGGLSVERLAVLERLRRLDESQRSSGDRGPMSLRAVAPAVGALLYTTVVEEDAKVVVEFGTSHGFSTLHLALGVERTGGHVYSVDSVAEKTRLASRNLAETGLHHVVTLSTSDGRTWVQSLPDEIDVLFVDYGLSAFAPAFPILRERLSPNAWIFVDGGPPGYWSEGAAAGFKATLDEDPDFEVTMLAMHKEQLTARRRSGLLR